MLGTTRYVGRHRVLDDQPAVVREAVKTRWMRRVLVPLSAVIVVVFGFGSTAFASPVHVKSGDTFSKLVRAHCGTGNWQSVSFSGRDKSLIYAGETINITCPGAAPAKTSSTSVPVPSPSPVSAASRKISTVVSFAMAQIGKPYRWAAAGPNSYDCSGLVMASYARIGIRLPHQTGAMLSYGVRVSRASLQVGDIVWLSSHHVGLYIGGNRIVVAPQQGERVKTQTIYAFYTARRIIA